MNDQIRTPEEIAPELAVKQKETEYLLSEITKVENQIQAFVDSTSEGQLYKKLTEKLATAKDEYGRLAVELREAGIHRWNTENPEDKQMPGGFIAIKDTVTVTDLPLAATSMIAWGMPEYVQLKIGDFNKYAKQHPQKVAPFAIIGKEVTFSIKGDLTPWLPPSGGIDFANGEPAIHVDVWNEQIQQEIEDE